MSQEPITPRQEPKVSPAKPPQYSLGTLFFGMFMLCVVLGIGYSVSAATGSTAEGIVCASFAALVSWAIWVDIVFRSPRITLVTSFLWFVLGMFVLPGIMSSLRPPSSRGQCSNNMKQITLALLNYESEHGSFPPAYTVDAQGNRLHSWRTLLLPQLEYRKAYRSIDCSQPWDAPANQQAMTFVPDIYQCLSHPRFARQPFTSYVAVIGPNTMWPGEQSRTMAEVSDGTSSTILLIEISRSDISWAEPRDLTLEEVLAAFRAGELTGISSYHQGSANFAFADGGVRRIDPSTLTEAKLRALLTIDDGEPERYP